MLSKMFEKVLQFENFFKTGYLNLVGDKSSIFYLIFFNSYNNPCMLEFLSFPCITRK